MNRSEIKALAKEKIKGNKWNILWPLLVIGFVFGIISNYTGAKYAFDTNTMQLILVSKGNTILSVAATLLEGMVTACYMKYILDFVRTGEFKTDTMLETFKAKWVDLLVATILMSVIIALGFVALVIPGIILAFAYSMVTFIIIDGDTKGVDALKTSREMMKGHKWEYFVFGLSFIGWCLLTPFTLGILLIWLIPYMIVAVTLYYENLKKLTK